MAGLRFGILPTPIYGAETSYRQQLDEHVELVKSAEEYGFSLMSCGQHFVGTELRYYQPVPYLGYLAHHAQRMRALIGITLLSMVNPVETAESVATLDAVTDGRVIFGAALGYSDREFKAMGVNPREKVQRFEEGVGLVRAMWSGEEVNVTGQHWSVEGVLPSVQPVQPGGPPVWIGAQSTPAVRRAARLGDAWYVPPFPSHDELRRLRAEYLQVRNEFGLSTAGDFPVRRELIVAGSRDEARRLAQERSELRYRTYRSWGLSGENQPTSGDRAGIDVERQFILGSPAEVVDELGRLQEDLGMTDFLFKSHWQGLPHADAMKQLELFGTQVVPQLL